MHIVFLWLERQWKWVLPVGINNCTSRGWSSVSWEMKKCVLGCSNTEELRCPCLPQFVLLISFHLKELEERTVQTLKLVLEHSQWCSCSGLLLHALRISSLVCSARASSWQLRSKKPAQTLNSFKSVCRLRANFKKFIRTSVFLRFSPPGLRVVQECFAADSNAGCV